ncbi:MAG: DUF1573 domain-containing protein [Prevotella sp.]|nr:DUF1573 domain-containing protein [Prevotella sp.]MBR4521630.1 DUF1573 domain-containing protein [Prevotella sp.]
MKKLLLIALPLLLFIACEKKLKPATVIIVDPVRHYYPVVQGDIMRVSYAIENVSENPLFIKEVQTTCGCLLQRDEMPIVILPHKQGHINIDFNTIKNTGYAQHFIYCYGNFKDSSVIELQFDTNIVPAGHTTPDYEELWQEQNGVRINEAVDGTKGEKGYYIDNRVSTRQQKQQEIQHEVDSHAF